MLSVQEEGSIAKTKCLAHELPECTRQLHGLVVEQPVRHGSEESRESEALKYKYATGYLQYTSPTTWNSWLQTFQLQTNTRYSIRQGKQSALKSGNHGLVQYCDQILGYKVEYTQTYHCFRVGTGRLKTEKENSLDHRSAPGSKYMGCPAKIYTRLLLLEDGNQLLEVKIPCLSVHEQHDPSSPADLQGLCPLPEVEEKVKSLIQQAYLCQVTLKLTLIIWWNMNSSQDTSRRALLITLPLTLTASILPKSTRHPELSGTVQKGYNRAAWIKV